MKIVFLLGSPDISGGTYVIFQHALKCLDYGNDVTIVTDEDVNLKRISWHKEASKLNFKKYKDIKNEIYDLAVATWWRTIYELPKVNAKNYIYFVQSIESRFFEDNEWALKNLIDATYTLPIPMITEATWIKEYLQENYHASVELVRNGIRKDIYNLEGEKYFKEDNKFRVLIEGPVDVPFKNVPNTIKIAKKSKADEVWLLTSSDVKKIKGVDRIFSRQSINDCAKIYRSCDVLVKLSLVEGMFGPPLEMFHCGGTAITYNVSGYDEYMKDKYNSLVADMNDEDTVCKLINDVYDNREFLNELKSNALKTASEWISWDESSEKFYSTLLKIKTKSYDTKQINKTILFYKNTYEMYLKKNVTIRKKVGNFLREKMPAVYKVYRKLIRK